MRTIFTVMSEVLYNKKKKERTKVNNETVVLVYKKCMFYIFFLPFLSSFTSLLKEMRTRTKETYIRREVVCYSFPQNVFLGHTLYTYFIQQSSKYNIIQIANTFLFIFYLFHHFNFSWFISFKFQIFWFFWKSFKICAMWYAIFTFL